MKKSNIVLIPVIFAYYNFFINPIISEYFLDARNMSKIWLLIFVSVIALAIILIVLFSKAISTLLGKLPSGLGFVKEIITKFLKLIRNPLIKLAFVAVLLTALLIVPNLISKISLVVLVFTIYYLELFAKQSGPLSQGKKTKFYDDFKNGIIHWDKIIGIQEHEANFGKPKPDILLKNVGNTSATPQTFLILKDIDVKKPSIIECDVYIESNGIFNLAFGILQDNSSYLMVRMDTRENEYDSLLFKPEGAGWNFIERSDRHRTSVRGWHKLRLEILSDKEINFYKDGELIITKKLNISVFGKLGLINEEADVHVDNFVITEI